MACRSVHKAEAAKAELEASGIQGQLSVVQLDVTDDASITAAVAHVQAQFGRLDVLINNAAGGGLQEPDLRAQLRMCMETNVIGAAVVADRFRPLLLHAPRPCSVWVSSGAGSLARNEDPHATHRLARGGAYCASKTAQNMLALTERVEHADTPLRVFIVCPGFVRSNLRGSSEDEQSGWGQAGDPDVSRRTLLDIVNGNRDDEVGKLLTKDGQFPW